MRAEDARLVQILLVEDNPEEVLLMLAELKADADLKSIPVIVLTTSGSEQDLMEAYDNSVNAYIRKPVSLDGFIEVVDSIDEFWLGVVALPPQPT